MDQEKLIEGAVGPHDLSVVPGSRDFVIIGTYRILPSDADLLAQLRQRGYDPVFQEFHESQLPAPG